MRWARPLGLILAVLSFVGAGALLPDLEQRTENAGLRYTDSVVEGAPPWVAVGTAIGALRGLVVDVLWIKVNLMKEEGDYFEVMALSDLITKLQPRFAAVWAYHGHNMAYNISVATHTLEERWDWVRAGVRLVQNEGLRHNPADLVLHKELAFWYAHKIEGNSDDAHLFYKREFTREWHFMLGEPPETLEDRIAWLRAIEDAPGSLPLLLELEPRCIEVRDRLLSSVAPLAEQAGVNLELDSDFLLEYGIWDAIRQNPTGAALLGIDDQVTAERPMAKALEEIAADPNLRGPLDQLVTFVRRRVLEDEYNLDPQRMRRYTELYGPLDWRNGQAHALYWGKKGEEGATARVAADDDDYKRLNNDRVVLQALQALARYGRVRFDPFSTEPPVRTQEPRFIDVIDREFEYYYTKHYDVKGAGGETFIDFLRNFMSSSIREAWRSGEKDRAQRLLDRLDERFGRGAVPPNNAYAIDLEIFVRNEVKQELDSQPHLAPTEARGALYVGFRAGVAPDRREVWEQALTYTAQVHRIFRGNEFYDYETKFGSGRIKDLMPPTLEEVVEVVFLQFITDPTIPLLDRAQVWQRVDSYNPWLRAAAERPSIRNALAQQFARSELSLNNTLEQLFPVPVDLEARQAAYERRVRDREAEREQDRKSGSIQRQN